MSDEKKINIIKGTNGNDSVNGTDRDDKITLLDGDDDVSPKKGNDEIDGGEGSDTISFIEQGPVIVDLSRNRYIIPNTSAKSFEDSLKTGFHGKIKNIENVRGSSYADLFIGNDKDNHFMPGSGSGAVINKGGQNSIDYLFTSEFDHNISCVVEGENASKIRLANLWSEDQATPYILVIFSDHDEYEIGSWMSGRTDVFRIKKGPNVVRQGEGVFHVYLLDKKIAEDKSDDETFAKVHGLNGFGNRLLKDNNHFVFDGHTWRYTQFFWDGSGVDTFDLSKLEAKKSAVVDLRQGQFSIIDNKKKAYIPIGADIDNIDGSDNGDNIFLNSHNNTVNTGKGDDNIYLSDRSIQYDMPVKDKQSSQGEVKLTGWGRDLVYASGGQDRYVIDVQNVRFLRFKKTNYFMRVKHAVKDKATNTYKRPSLHVTSFDGENTLFLVRVRSEEDKQYLEKTFAKAVNKAKTSSFAKEMKTVDLNSPFGQRIKSYDQTITKLSNKPQASYDQYVALAF